MGKYAARQHGSDALHATCVMQRPEVSHNLGIQKSDQTQADAKHDYHCMIFS